jgi:hypothetical protein
MMTPQLFSTNRPTLPAEMIINDYKVNGRRSLGRIEECLAHITGSDKATGFFGKRYKAAHVTDDRIGAYVAHRKDEKAKNATINRELACLRRMFRLGTKARKVVFRPEITLLVENNVRKGFLQPDQVREVVAYLDTDVAPVVEVASITGWRLASEILTRQWHHVDFKGGWLRLEPGETKENEPRMFPMTCAPCWSARGSGPQLWSRLRAASSRGSSIGLVHESGPSGDRGSPRAGRPAYRARSRMT